MNVSNLLIALASAIGILAIAASVCDSIGQAETIVLETPLVSVYATSC